MLHVVTQRNAGLYRGALREMFAMRHRIFVDRLGWKALRKPDGLERDEFDTPDAIYLLLFDEDKGSLIGSHRLLRTTGPHLMSEIFRNTCTRCDIIRGPRIFEVSRSCIDEERIPPHKCRYYHALLMGGMQEFVVKAKIERVTGILGIELLSRYLREGVPFEPLGPPVELDGADYVPVTAPVTSETLINTRQAGGLVGPLVQYFAPRPVNPSVIPKKPGSPVRWLQ